MRSVILIAAGLGLLAVGGELLVRGAAGLAARFGLRPLVIGLTVVAFGTSAPELAVSLRAVYTGSPDFALGNVVGSNIFNILAILGVAALIAPIAVSRRVIRVEVPIMIGISGLAAALALDGRYDALDGLMLLLAVAVYTFWLFKSGAAEPASNGEDARQAGVGTIRAALLVAAGLVLLVAGARWLVDGAAMLARAFGVGDAVIGLTIVAAGTSLPEVAASIAATWRGHGEMAVGNVIGSSVFNLTAILGTTAVVAGDLAVPPGVLTFDIVVMLAVSVACLPILYTKHLIARWEGALFAAYYVAYIAYLVLDATDHGALPRFQDAMVWFALPMTMVTLVVLVGRTAWRRARTGDDV